MYARIFSLGQSLACLVACLRPIFGLDVFNKFHNKDEAIGVKINGKKNRRLNSV